MVRRCPKCGSKMLKDSTAVVKLRALDARYYCTNCGYFGALVWEDGDFKKVDTPQIQVVTQAAEAWAMKLPTS